MVDRSMSVPDRLRPPQSFRQILLRALHGFGDCFLPRQERRDRRGEGATSAVCARRPNSGGGEVMEVPAVEQNVDGSIALSMAAFHHDIPRAKSLKLARRLAYLLSGPHRVSQQVLGLR